MFYACHTQLLGDPKKTEPINFFITSTKIKQNNSNFVHLNFWTCSWILWSQFFMHRIYFIPWKKEKVRIKFMNFSQKYMGSVFLGVTLYIQSAWHYIVFSFKLLTPRILCYLQGVSENLISFHNQKTYQFLFKWSQILTAFIETTQNSLFSFQTFFSFSENGISIPEKTKKWIIKT